MMLEVRRAPVEQHRHPRRHWPPRAHAFAAPCWLTSWSLRSCGPFQRYFERLQWVPWPGRRIWRILIFSSFPSRQPRAATQLELQNALALCELKGAQEIIPVRFFPLPSGAIVKMKRTEKGLVWLGLRDLTLIDSTMFNVLRKKVRGEKVRGA